MSWNGGQCWYCGYDLDALEEKLYNQESDSTEIEEEFNNHFYANCIITSTSDLYNEECGRYLIIEKRKFICSQKTHPSNVHHGKAWNKITNEYDFVSWDVTESNPTN